MASLTAETLFIIAIVFIHHLQGTNLDKPVHKVVELYHPLAARTQMGKVRRVDTSRHEASAEGYKFCLRFKLRQAS